MYVYFDPFSCISTNLSVLMRALLWIKGILYRKSRGSLIETDNRWKNVL